MKGSPLKLTQDQTGNSMQETLTNADAEGVADRIEPHTRDQTDLQFPDASFDVVVSSLAIHNRPGNRARLSAIDGALRVLRPAGRVIVADIGFTRLQQRGMAGVKISVGARGEGCRASPPTPSPPPSPKRPGIERASADGIT
jgi:arsenite methyltransferase